MKSFLDSMRKYSEFALAHDQCDKCIFKVVDFNREPCLGCRFGQFGGTEKNFVPESEEEK